MMKIVFDIEKLRNVAIDQYGYITTSQAAEEGVSKQSLAMLVKRNRLERVAQGIYRVPQVAPTPFDRFMLALLWTGCPEAALSHETALDAYEVCDVNPAAIHVVVGRSRRIRRTGGEGYVIHRQDLDRLQIGWWEGMPTVKLEVAINQCLDLGTPGYLLDQAITNGKKRGLLNDKEEKELKEKLERRQ